MTLWVIVMVIVIYMDLEWVYACFHHDFLPSLTFCHVLMVGCLKDEDWRAYLSSRLPALKDLYHVDVIIAIIAFSYASSVGVMLIFINVSELCEIPIEGRLRSIHRRLYYGLSGVHSSHVAAAHDRRTWSGGGAPGFWCPRSISLLYSPIFLRLFSRVSFYLSIIPVNARSN